MLLRIPFTLTLLAICFGSSSLSYSQQDQGKIYQSDSVIRTNVVLVPVDVVVRDSSGRYIDNLQANSFSIYDNNIAQQIALYSRQEIPLDLALVIDISGSVKPYAMQLRNSAEIVLQNLDSKEDRVALFCFDNQPYQLTGLTPDRFIPARLIGNMFDIMGRGNSTSIKGALYEASRYLRTKSQQRRRAIILVSDNLEPITMRLSVDEVLKELLESGAVIYSIRTKGKNVQKTDPKVIDHLVQDTGGEILNADSVADLTKALNGAIASLNHSYLLGFNPTDPGQEGSYHAIKVTLNSGANCSKCKVQARKGYFLGGGNAGIMAPGATTRPPGLPFYSQLIKGFQDLLPFVDRRLIWPKLLNNKDNVGMVSVVPQECIRFTLKATRLNYEGDKQVVEIDLKFETDSLIFVFIDDKHRSWFTTALLFRNRSDPIARLYEVGFSEEQFRRVLQSGLNLSMTVSIPKGEEMANLLVVDTFKWPNYGTKSVPIQPQN
jgi:VWFA-related protein